MQLTTGEIISVGTGKLCCELDRVYVILSFLTGETLFTHQLPRAFKQCEGWIKQQHPWLNSLDTTKCSRETWKSFLDDAERQFGKEHELLPLPPELQVHCDPIEEATGLFGREKLIVIEKGS